jgi:hypothetical protein
VHIAPAVAYNSDMVGMLVSSLSQLPFLVASCVLGGFAIWGWRRSGLTDALLIAIAAAVQLLHQLFGIWTMTRLYSDGPAAYGRMMMLYGVFRSAGALIADVLFIVGVALLLRRLPTKARTSQR